MPELLQGQRARHANHPRAKNDKVSHVRSQFLRFGDDGNFDQCVKHQIGDDRGSHRQIAVRKKCPICLVEAREIMLANQVASARNDIPAR
ncbi:hypothetical protein D9M69_706300 [compost metagenome]